MHGTRPQAPLNEKIFRQTYTIRLQIINKIYISALWWSKMKHETLQCPQNKRNCIFE